MNSLERNKETTLSGKYAAYPEYKDSGVEWLDGIPTGWNLPKLKYKTIRIGDGLHSTPKYREGTGFYFVNGNNLVGGKVVLGMSAKEVPKTEYEEHYVRLDDNSVLLSINGTIGNVARYNNEPIILGKSAAYINCTSDLQPEFLMYYLQSAQIQRYFDLEVTGTTIFNLSLNSIRQLVVCMPIASEQTQIANFLDHEIAKIDTLIDKQQQLIQLLKEKRQAVINHAVTKGLNPDAAMKDSGVEWLGEVPEHWGVSCLSYYAVLNTGATPDRSNSQYWIGDIPWIKTGEVNYDIINEVEESISVDALRHTSVRISPPGTLLMAMYGQGVTRGRVAILGVSATYNQACVAISPTSKLWNEYLRYYFIAGYYAIRDGGNETSQMNLNADIVSKFKVLVPSIDEQHKIVDYLESKLPSFDCLLDKAESAIKLMQERRTALISAAVTGKIDVRHFTLKDGNV